MPEQAQTAVAVVGLGALFPAAPDVDTFWDNICGGVDAITDVPPTRLDPEYFAAASDPGRADRFYCRRGGFVDDVATFDPTRFGIMPMAVQSAEPDQMLALRTADAALDDAGTLLDDVARERIGVIVGRGGYVNAGIARLEQKVRGAQQLVESLRTVVPSLTDEQLEAVREDFQRQLGPDRPEASIGLVPNLGASRIANRLDLLGPAYTIDAACASSLIAIDSAVRELESHRCDAVVAGGVHHCHDVTIWSVFTQLRALSPSGSIRPFSAAADGILIGEGTGMVVLERLEDAERLGHRVYAVVRGTGVASDGRDASLMSPRVEGQVLALERAYGRAEIDPATVGLVEAHGTATPAGDRAELDTLRRIFGKADDGRPTAGLGSVKSMIGHAMPAAGAAGFIKAVLGVHHAVLPPTLHADEPNPALADTRFRLVGELEPWTARDGQPRRAGVNAFGFGGINAHVIVEEHGPSRPSRPGTSGSIVRPTSTIAERKSAGELVVLLAGTDAGDVLRQLDGLGPSLLDAPPADTLLRMGDGAARLAVVAPTAKRLDIARRLLERGRAWRGRNDVWFEPEGLVTAGGRVAFVFPGVEPTFDPHLEDVERRFGRRVPPVPDGAGELEAQGRAIFAHGRFLHDVLGDLGIEPHDILGHSLGEWTGMMAAELVPSESVDPFVDSLEPGCLDVPGVVYAALGCGVDTANDVVGDLEGVIVSHDNCPHQSVVCGDPASIAEALDRFGAAKVLAQELPFRSGFHSPMFAPYLDPIRAHWRRMPLQPARVPLWSATTCDRYPDDPAAMRDLLAEHLLQPVRFRELVERVHDDGVRVFVQVGLGSLVGFIDDTLKDREHLAVAGHAAKQSGLGQLRRLGAALWVEGVDVAFDRLVATGTSSSSPAAPAPTGPLLPLGLPLVRLSPSVAAAVADTSVDAARDRPAEGASPASTAFADVMREARSASTDVMRALDAAPAGRRRPPVAAAAPVATTPPAPAAAPVDATAVDGSTTTSLHLSVVDQPWLLDHSFFRIPEGWPDVSDGFPVVPMTNMIQLMGEAAQRVRPGRVVTRFDDIRAMRWLAVTPPVDVTVRTAAVDDATVKCAITGYSRGTVRVEAAYPPAPAPALVGQLAGERPSPITAEQLYGEHLMFHGPEYQGVRSIDALADNGLRGVIECLPAPGAVIDNVGQLFGYWVTATAEDNFLALPLSIERIELFGPFPAPGERLDAVVLIRSVDDRMVRCDMELVQDDHVLVKVTGWIDRRFDSDEQLWEMIRYPEREPLSTFAPAGYAMVTERWRDSASRELMMRSYLCAEERADYDTRNPKAQREFLLGRMAAKDAVRRALWDDGEGPMFPVEITLRNGEHGEPLASWTSDDRPWPDVRVSIAHADGVGVAMVGVGHDVGIDIEAIEPRSPRFADLALTDDEAQLAPVDADPDRWLTRLWAAKEAAAKATGHGLGGRPKDFEVEAVAGERLRIGDRWIATDRVTAPDGPETKEYIVAWTD